MICADCLGSAACNRDHSPFLRLPAEIRNLIFKYRLGGVEIRVQVRKPIATDDGIHTDLQTSPVFTRLALVSTQIKQETELLAFRLGRFRV